MSPKRACRSWASVAKSAVFSSRATNGRVALLISNVAGVRPARATDIDGGRDCFGAAGDAGTARSGRILAVGFGAVLHIVCPAAFVVRGCAEPHFSGSP